MDGARLMNAVVASGTPAKAFAAPFDSVWLDLTKGLGAPVGAVLAGSRAFIEEAWVFKQRFGGAMRQAGIIAAAGIYALDHHVDRLAEDHERARALARGLAELPGIAVDADRVETNIVIFDVRGTGLTAEEFGRRHRAVRRPVHGPRADAGARGVASRRPIRRRGAGAERGEGGVAGLTGRAGEGRTSRAAQWPPFSVLRGELTIRR